MCLFKKMSKCELRLSEIETASGMSLSGWLAGVKEKVRSYPFSYESLVRFANED